MKLTFKAISNNKIEVTIEISENTKIVKVLTKEEATAAYGSLRKAINR